ncbi:MAG TPA: diguanylate cyclase [Steroidobacteraceae bacterium]|nr:diguanylate cyclase [Steroidobacteraceae bacterium]
MATAAIEPSHSVAQIPRRGWLRLRFPPELEAEFLLSYRAAARRWVRLSMLVVLCTSLGFAVIDHWVLIGPHLPQADMVRFGLQLPLVIIILVMTTERFYGRWYQPSIQVAAPLFGIGTVLMAMQATPDQLPLVAARLLLATFYFYSMLGLTLGAAFRTNLVVVSCYVAAALAGDVAHTVAIYQTYVLLCANVIGGAGCYALEHANRIAFLERRRLAEVAMHDGLTGLLNRAALDEQVRALWRHAERDRLPVSVVLIDIDHFKAYNDHYGHQAGDRCLREVAAAVKLAARRRPLDLVARYGGEEIIAVLFGADSAHAEEVAIAVKEGVTKLHLEHLASPTRPYVTVSVGVATLGPGAGYSHDNAVQLADRALYAAKAGGRDRWLAVREQDRKAAPLPDSPDGADAVLQTAS